MRLYYRSDFTYLYLRERTRLRKSPRRIDVRNVVLVAPRGSAAYVSYRADRRIGRASQRRKDGSRAFSCDISPHSFHECKCTPFYLKKERNEVQKLSTNFPPFGGRSDGVRQDIRDAAVRGKYKKRDTRAGYLFFVGTRPLLFLTFSYGLFRSPFAPIPNCSRLSDGSPLPHGGDGSRLLFIKQTK